VDIRQKIINFASKLRKQFPQEDGRYAIVMQAPSTPSMNEGFEGDPTADTRPEMVRKDEDGWQRIGVYKDNS
jgi:hypothetical protein